ncbi:MAG: M28 family peptidase [Chryseolinea sp.]
MNRVKIFAFAVLVTVFSPCYGQDAKITAYGDKVSAAELREYLSILASDAMEGRETGKRGQKMAAAFLKSHFGDLGLTPPVAGDYIQPLDLYTIAPGDTYIMAGNKKYENFGDVVFYGNDNSDGEISSSLVFIGKGMEADLVGMDIKGKAVLILIDGPLLAGNKEISSALEKGATMVFACSTINDDFNNVSKLIKSTLAKAGLSLTRPEPADFEAPGIFVISPTVIPDLAGVSFEKLKEAANNKNKKALRRIKPMTVRYKMTTDVKTVKTENVLGFLEGSDKKDEIVVVTAHYDHIGVKSDGTGDVINNGADDDGSGSVAVMEIAKVFSAAKKNGHGPRRSILFMLVTGEEFGLLGSEFYTEHPVYPLQNTVVDLNIDMIGRRDPKHKDDAPYLYVIGADKLSTTLNEVSESVNNTYSKLNFDYTYNDQAHPDRLYYRSDHWNFAKRNIPIIFYFDGIHEDYHRVSDEVSKIDFELLATRTRCIFYTAWEIANREERIMPDKSDK